MIDMVKMGAFVQESMEHLEREFPDAELGEIILIAELKNGESTTVRYSCTDPRVWVHSGLMRMALMAAEES